jgi:hypothetical protein
MQRIPTRVEKFFNFKVHASLATLIICIIDYIIPPGTAVGALYLIPLAMLIDEEKITIYVFSIILTFLILLDFFYNLNETTHFSIYGDRVISIIVLWVLSYIVIRHKILRDKAARMKDKHTKAVDEMLFKTNHQVRHSVTQLLGTASYLIEMPEDSAQQLPEFLTHIKQCAQELDIFTVELTEFIIEQKMDETD